MAQAHSVMHITIRACFLCFFYNPYNYVPFNLKIFSFTSLHSFITCLKLHAYYSFSANQELNFFTYGENTICRPMYPSPQNVNIALGQEAVATQFLIDLGLAELHNVRDSAALQSYIDSWSQAFSDSQAWLHKARSYRR